MPPPWALEHGELRERGEQSDSTLFQKCRKQADQRNQLPSLGQVKEAGGRQGL